MKSNCRNFSGGESWCNIGRHVVESPKT